MRTSSRKLKTKEQSGNEEQLGSVVVWWLNSRLTKNPNSTSVILNEIPDPSSLEEKRVKQIELPNHLENKCPWQCKKDSSERQDTNDYHWSHLFKTTTGLRVIPKTCLYWQSMGLCRNHETKKTMSKSVL